MTPEPVKLELTPEDAYLFQSFREHQDNFTALLRAGVFEVRNGRVTLHFDPQGIIRTLDFNATRHLSTATPGLTGSASLLIFQYTTK